MCCWLIMRTGSMARTSQYSASILHSICKFFINFAFVHLRLLGDAISPLRATKETTDLFSFVDRDSGSLFGNEVRGLDDFELIFS